MANHKSALKRDRQSQQRRLRNRNNRTQVKNAIRKINEAVAAQSVEGAQEALRSAIPVIDRAAVKGAIHKKNASRKVSRLTRKVNALNGATQAAS
ncbi:MAG: 30S ribosomal protein S20 [Deltaproteobacteria bacterium]